MSTVTRGTVTRSADRGRRHTRYFLEWARSAAPVQLSVDVDMSSVQEHRRAARVGGTRYSVVSYLLLAVGRVLARHPEANATAVGRRVPRVVGFRGVHAKLALDRTAADGTRSVRTAVIRDVDLLELPDIQGLVDRYRDGPAEQLPGAAGVRLLGRLPAPLGRLAFRAAVARPSRRSALLGTVAVSALGHRRVDVFHSFGGTAVTVASGRISDRPVVRDGAVAAAPVLTLGLTFDHRVVDGATAADLLDELAALLENWKDEP